MKILITLLITSFMMFIKSPEKKVKSKKENNITVTVINASSNEGKVVFALFDKENFLRIPLQGKSSKIINGKSTIVFDNVSAGEYAITCYHDKNNNDKMDFSPQGMPIEDYGASNNVMTLGPPQYYNAKFMINDKNVSLEIKF